MPDKHVSEVLHNPRFSNFIASFGELRNKTLSQLGTLIGLKMSDEIPKSLYKYTTLNFYTIKNLYNNTVTLTRPILFNDPFDSLFYESKDEMPLVVQQGYISKDIADKLKPQKSIPRSNTMNRGQRLLRVSSLTRTYNNFLMWSHYANNDCGICISYDLSTYSHRKYVFPVVYLHKPFDFSKFGNFNYDKRDKALMLLAYSGIIKSILWKNEQEWRIIIPLTETSSRTDRIYYYGPDVNCIYLGPNFIGYWLQTKLKSINDPESFNNLHSYFYPFCDFVKKNEVPLRVMKLVPSIYRLRPEPISINDLCELGINNPALRKYFNLDFLGRY